MYKMQGMGKGAVAVLVASMALAACGGGDDGDSSSSSTSTATAAASSSSSSQASSSSGTTTSSSSSSGGTTTATSGSWIPTRSDLSSYLATCSSGTQNFSAAGTYTDGVATLYTSSASKLRLYDKGDTTSCSSTGGTNGVLAINYNGDSFDSSRVAVGGTVTPSSAYSYIKIPYTAVTTAPTLKVYYTYVTSSSYACDSTTHQVFITNASGTVLSVATPCDATSTQATLSATDSTTVGTSGGFYIFFTRGNTTGATTTGGGLRVWQADYTN